MSQKFTKNEALELINKFISFQSVIKYFLDLYQYQIMFAESAEFRNAGTNTSASPIVLQSSWRTFPLLHSASRVGRTFRAHKEFRSRERQKARVHRGAMLAVRHAPGSTRLSRTSRTSRWISMVSRCSNPARRVAGLTVGGGGEGRCRRR